MVLGHAAGDVRVMMLHPDLRLQFQPLRETCAHVLRVQIVSHGARLIVAGIAIGASAAIALSRVLTGLLYQVSPTDPATFTLVGIALVAAALAACFIPARRLLATDPVESLRHE